MSSAGRLVGERCHPVDRLANVPILADMQITTAGLLAPFLPISFAALTALAATACGGPPPPNDALTASVAAARSAREIGAESAPQAALHLKLADEEIGKAKSLIQDGDNERASYVLIRAKADAELALALAKEASAKADAERASEQIKALQQ
ncbi:MAG TPA: DUF4398 domain-containing protein [Polyangiaceae bacterium]